MLSIVSIPQPIQSTIGKYETIKVSVASDEALTGKVLRVNPALYLSQYNEPLNKGYEIVYPAAGTTTMSSTTINGANHEVELTVNSAYSFDIEYSFFAQSDFGGYQSDVVSNYGNVFTGGGVNSNVVIDFHVEDEHIGATIPINVNALCSELNVSIGATTVATEFEVTVQSLDISPIDNNFYVLWYNENQGTGLTDIVDDLGINYALIDNTFNAVGSLPTGCIVSGDGIASNRGRFNVDKTCLNDGGVYRAIIIYNQQGQWKSCRSEPIQDVVGINQTLADVNVTITDQLGNSTNDTCVSGLSDCVNLTIQVDIDKASYDANLATNQITGSFDDYAKSIKMSISGTAMATTITDTAATYQLVAEYMPTSGFSGAKEILVEAVFDYGTHRDNQKTIIDLIYNPSGSRIELEEDLCIETGGIANFTITSSGTCITKESVNGSDPVDANISSIVGTNLAIDIDKMDVGTEICAIGICSSGTTATALSDCEECPDCVPIIVDIDATYNAGLNNWDIVFTNSDGVMDVNGTGGTFNGVTGNNFSYIINISKNGCVYHQVGFISLNTILGTYNETLSITSINDKEDCTCSGVDCDSENYASFSGSCNPTTHTITLSSNDSFASTVTSDVTEHTLDGTTWIAGLPASVTGENEITVTRRVTFEECDELYVTQTFTCIKEETCINTREIVSSFNGTTLDITLTDNFTSTAIEDTMFVSIDGGAYFEEYDLLGAGYTPQLAITGNENIIIQTTTKYSERCNDLMITHTNNLSTPQTQDCDYASLGLTLTATWASGTSLFTVTQGGTTTNLVVNELLWAIDQGNPLSGSGVDYITPVEGTGVFIAAWRVRLPGCEEHIIYASAYGEPSAGTLTLPDPVNILVTNDCNDPIPFEFCTDGTIDVGDSKNLAGK